MSNMATWVDGGAVMGWRMPEAEGQLEVWMKPIGGELCVAM